MRVFLRRFGAAVRAQREARGLSQEDLGFEANLDRTYISGLERGVRNPTIATVIALAKALKVQVSRLVTSAEK